jgi:Flp pilus assembly secretin CpaC
VSTKRHAELIEGAEIEIDDIKEEVWTTLSPAERSKCLTLAADLAERCEMNTEAKRLRDEAAKNVAPTGVAELLNRRQAQLDALQKQVSGLRRLTHTEEQIQVDLKIYEISAAKLETAGISLPRFKGGDRVESTEKPTQCSPHHIHGPRVIDAGDELFVALNRMKEEGITKVIAEPTVVTVSGRPGWINSGGEFPYIIRRGNEDPTIEFKQFGTRVEVLPFAIGNERIRLEVLAKTSRPDEKSAAKLEGVVVPGLWIREIDTGVELKSGQTIVIFGPPQIGHADAEKSSTGAAKSDSNSDAEKKTGADETQLLVVATPRLVTAPDAAPDAKSSGADDSSARRGTVAK